MNRPLSILVEPSTLPTVPATAVTQVYTRLGMHCRQDPFALPVRKKTLTNMDWEIPGVGLFNRGELLRVLGVTQHYLSVTMREHRKSGVLPSGWLPCLWLCARNQRFLEFCVATQEEHCRTLLHLPRGYWLSNAELRVLFAMTENQLRYAQTVGARRTLSLVFDWLEKFPAYVIEQMVFCRRHQGGLTATEEQVLARIEVSLAVE